MSETETLFAALRQSSDEAVVDMLERMVRDAPDHALNKMNALDLAGTAGIDEERVAGEGVPRHQGSDRRSQRLRPDHRRGRLCVGQLWRRPGRQRDPDSQGGFGCSDGLGRLHRLRRLRRGLQYASAHLFVGAKISHLALLPQGEVERARRAVDDGRAGRHRRFRQLLERRRVRSGVPEGDSHLEHRADDARVRPRDAELREDSERWYCVCSVRLQADRGRRRTST